MRLILLGVTLLVAALTTSMTAQPVPGASFAVPRTVLPLLVPAPPVDLPGDVDSNSPAFWDFSGGLQQLHVLTSSGHPQLNIGTTLQGLVPIGPVQYSTQVDGRRWMEAVVQDAGGILYGYYHLEPNNVCDASGKTSPRIGAARSADQGRSWEDLGIILEAPPNTDRCMTRNELFVGGVGDFSVILDPDRFDLYIFYTAYTGRTAEQGIAAARLPWAERDAPAGHVSVWKSGAWRPPDVADDGEVLFEAPTPIFPAAGSWHDIGGRVDAFWGPSVHWNTYLQHYVMLLNRASGPDWEQEGIYISFSVTLNPPRWSMPRQLLSGGLWYPQVLGLEAGEGTDKLAGERARLFLGGRSEQILVFRRPS